MKEKSQIAITISRKIGSGGAYIGQELAKKLGIFYLDREIIKQTANQVSISEEELESRDEKVPSYWKVILQSGGYRNTDAYMPPHVFTQTDGDLFKAEAEIIKQNAKEHSVVVVGRCGAYILREHPNHVNIFLYGNSDFRGDRIQKQYDVSEEEAQKMMTQNDKERSRYIHTFTGKIMTEASQYDLSIDTSKIGVDHCVQLILQYLELI